MFEIIIDELSKQKTIKTVFVYLICLVLDFENNKQLHFVLMLLHISMLCI